MEKDLSLLEKLEIARRWENLRLAYFTRDGDNEKIKELTQNFKLLRRRFVSAIILTLLP